MWFIFIVPQGFRIAIWTSENEELPNTTKISPQLSSYINEDGESYFITLRVITLDKATWRLESCIWISEIQQ
jgi:hypothetical protein